MKKSLNERLFVFLVLVWPIAHFAVFWLGMNSSMFYNAFFKTMMDGTQKFVGWDMFKDVIAQLVTGTKIGGGISNPKAITNVFSLFGLAFLVNMPITILFSFAIYKKMLGHNVFRITLFIPAVLPVVVLCLVFLLAVNDINNGIFNHLLRIIGLGGNGIDDFGIIPRDGSWLGNDRTAWKTILVFSVWTGVSGNLIYFNSAMGRIPSSIMESAELDGASELRQFITIVIPMIWPTVITMVITGFSQVMAWFMPALLMTNGGPDGATSTISLIIVTNTRNGNYGYVSALGSLVAVLGGGLVLTVKLLMEKLIEEVEY